LTQPPRRVLYLAAHGGFTAEAVPLGGGAAVSDLLLSEWSVTRPFEFQLLSPEILGARAPSGEDLVRYSEREYAAFCREFGRACTAEVLRHAPGETAVLVNDVSEGPDFGRLAAAGFRIHTIYHVDVPDYVARIYARGLLSPEAMVRCWEWMRRSPLRAALPRIAGLVFDQQRDSVEHSRTCVVPSQAMKEVILRCYPSTPASRIEVLPWGAPPLFLTSLQRSAEAAKLRAEFGVPKDALVLLALSRISPEKGQDLLLEALLEWERRGGLPQRPLWLFICGGAAYMMGQRHLVKLRELASRLRSVTVRFPGHVTGARKEGFFELADVYVFPSRHESYGLTLMEAFSAGLPAICLDHHGARSVMSPELGEMIELGSHRVTVQALQGALKRLLADPRRLEEAGAAAESYALSNPFGRAASRLAEIVAAG
jgi:glycosyltransferase involved in cell wall biosynthesis